MLKKNYGWQKKPCERPSAVLRSSSKHTWVPYYPLPPNTEEEKMPDRSANHTDKQGNIFDNAICQESHQFKEYAEREREREKGSIDRMAETVMMIRVVRAASSNNNENISEW